MHTFLKLFTLSTKLRTWPTYPGSSDEWIEAYPCNICLTADLNDINVYAEFDLWVLMRIKVSSHSESNEGQHGMG